MKRIGLLGSICLIISAGMIPAAGQSPYQLDPTRELAIIGAGMSLHALSWMLKEEIDPFTAEQISRLDRRSISEFDRSATYHYSISAANSSDLVRNICIALPAALAAGRPRSELGKVGVLLGETYLLVSGTTYLAKTAFHRPRPYVYNEAVGVSEKRSLNAQFSFISGHTSVSSGLSFFTAKVFSDYYPESPLKPFVWGVAATLPAVTGYFRVKAGKHYPSDVIAGYLVGAIGGILVPAMHKTTRRASVHGLHLRAGGTSLGIVYQF
ncbi:MAG: phosphatase PAP2 family protein [Saprospiraceae bacterium]|nr:phosphatase PAP2 family protein [Saprospiraceae bacterium]